MSFYKTKSFFAQHDQLFLTKHTLVQSFNEGADGTVMVPRFTLKEADIFKDFPANVHLKYKKELLLKAMQWGMVIEITYKGEEDDLFEGHDRVIYPMIYGKTKDKKEKDKKGKDGKIIPGKIIPGGKELLMAYHLKGWSVSENANIEKVWRMFRCDRILDIVFTGAFYRLAPDGYNVTDKQMNVIASADFTGIRNMQQSLLNQNRIDPIEHVILTKVKDIFVKDLNWNMKIFNPFEGNIIQKKDAKNIRVTFAKPVVGSGQHIVIVGISVNTNNIFTLKDQNGKAIGTYKCIKWKMASNIEKEPPMREQVEFKAYMYVRST